MMLLVLAALAGLLMMLVGSLMFLIAAFGVSIWWGIFCIFFPPTNVLFLLVNWKAAKKPFLVILIGFLLVIAPLTLVDNFLTSMRDSRTMHFRHFSQSNSVTTTPATGSTVILLPPVNTNPIVPGQPGAADIVDPQSAADLPRLPEQKK